MDYKITSSDVFSESEMNYEVDINGVFMGRMLSHKERNEVDRKVASNIGLPISQVSDRQYFRCLAIATVEKSLVSCPDWFDSSKIWEGLDFDFDLIVKLYQAYTDLNKSLADKVKEVRGQ